MVRERFTTPMEDAIKAVCNLLKLIFSKKMPKNIPEGFERSRWLADTVIGFLEAANKEHKDWVKTVDVADDYVVVYGVRLEIPECDEEFASDMADILFWLGGEHELLNALIAKIREWKEICRRLHS